MYGYGRISIKGNTLKYQYVVIPSGRVYDEWSIIKSVNKAANVEAKS